MLVSNMDLTARGDQALVNGTKGKVRSARTRRSSKGR